MKKEKSLKINMVLSAIKGMLSIIFPLISFPYISKVLGVSNIGKYNFSYSVVNYFVLIAALGIKIYAVREGARLRGSKQKFENFANQMFTINIISTVIAYFLFTITILIVPKFAAYRTTLIILSFQIIFITIGVEWIYTVYEDFLYITLMSIASNVLSIILLFMFVHDESDLNMYATIVVVASVGSNFVNLIHSRKYCKLHLVKDIDWHIHIKPIITLFSMQIATTIFTSSDTTILGFMYNDEVVGVYSISSKVYSIIKTVLSSIIVVSIPRLSSLLDDENKKAEFAYVAQDTYKTLVTTVIPVMVLIMVLRRQVVLIVSDVSYIKATTSLLILCISLMFCMGAWFWGQSILVPMKKEGLVFRVTVLSAVINVVLNFLLIPFGAENAAAFTTLVSEAVAFCIQYKEGRKYVNMPNILATYWKVALGTLPIIFYSKLLYFMQDKVFIYCMVVGTCSVVSYLIIEILLKNDSIFNVINEIKLRKGEKLNV